MDVREVWGRIAWLGGELRANEMAAVDVGKEVSFALFSLAAASPQQFSDFKTYISKLLGIDDLTRWFEETIKGIDGDDVAQYQLANCYSGACVYGNDFPTALRIWSFALTASRGQVEQLEAINEATAIEYDGLRQHQQASQVFMDFLRPRLNARNDFLDLCCGTGLTTESLGLDDKRITGIDLELSGLRACGRTPMFSSLHQGDAKKILPALPAADFEAIWCCGAMYFFADPSWIFTESSRLLRPGGLLCLNVWPSPESLDVSITKAGSFRYCHSHGYLMRLADMVGMHLSDIRWSVTYNMPTWLMLFEKNR